MDIKLLTIVSTLFVFFLPGFFISLVFFKWNAIDLIERLVVSFGMSIVIVPLLLFYGNLVGVSLSSITVIGFFATILVLTGAVLGIQHITANLTNQ